MSSVTIKLSESQQAFVDAQVKAGGLQSASEYLAFLVQAEQLRRNHRERIDARLLEAINGAPATPLTAQDWEDIEREGLARLAEEKQHAPKRRQTRRSPKRPA